MLYAGFDSGVNERANAMRWPAGKRRYDLAIALELLRLRPPGPSSAWTACSWSCR